MSMLPKLIYVPLEPYEQRYTAQLARPVTGWNEAAWIANDIPYYRVEGVQLIPTTIKVGQVLDGQRRWAWSSQQISELIGLACTGALTSEHVIFFDDFWTPGIEQLAYVLSQLNLHPKMYSFCYAQSVDEFDFTTEMLPWIRDFEKGIGKCMTGVFVANSKLKDLLASHGVVSRAKIHVTGLPFDSREVASIMPLSGTVIKEDIVVFSSRWDKEKDPGFFCDVAREVWKSYPDCLFIVATGADELTSNDPALLGLAQGMMDEHEMFDIEKGLGKDEYYELLASAKIQFNCAKQDWVSFTLLEASVAGCYPIYPNYRSFPETFTRGGKPYGDPYLYEPGNVQDAGKRIVNVLAMGSSVFSRPAQQSRHWIHQRFDRTWARQAQVMGLLPNTPYERNPYGI